MIEKVNQFSLDDVATVEKLVDSKNVSIAHAVVGVGESFPKHNANANVSIILVKGTMSAVLGDQKEHVYSKGSIISVPLGTSMGIKNIGDESVEFFAIKAPSPTFK